MLHTVAVVVGAVYVKTATVSAVKVNPVSPVISPRKNSTAQPIEPHKQQQKMPTEAAKTTPCGHSESSGMSTKDMVQLIMAVQMVEKLNEITSNIIEKYLKG
tara:strand:+ start:98 stop:403 length:306 start_codon:yes stop_codon:yes gene_type:complete